MNRIKRYKILNCLKSYNPTPNIELDYSSPFELLIAVLLSARTRDSQVNKVTKVLFEVANTPKKMLELQVEGIVRYIQSIGLFNNKANNIIKTCYLLLKNYNGEIPEDRVALESLPGVGRKTSNILLNIIFEWPTIAVDTHVFRVCNRTKFAVGKSVSYVERKLLHIVPNIFKKDFHHWFVSHGRYVCLAKKPKCYTCVIFDFCEYYKKNY